MEVTVGCWFQIKVSSSDVAEVSDKKNNQKDISADAHSSDLFSVHNFDVTIDLNFPAGWCCSVSLVIFIPVSLFVLLVSFH